MVVFLLELQDTLRHTFSFFIDFFFLLSYINIPKTRTGGGSTTKLAEGQKRTASSNASRDRIHRLRQGGRQQNLLKDRKIAGSNASRDRIPRLRQGGRQQNSLEEENDYGFDRVKDLVPRQRQGGRQQNSLKKKKIMGSTASKTWSLANGRGVDNRTHGRRTRRKRLWVRPRQKTWSLANGRGVDNRTHWRRKRLWVRPRQRPGPSPTAGGSTTELTEEEKDYGFNRVKDLVPRQRQGGRQQNSRKKKKNVLRHLELPPKLHNVQRPVRFHWSGSVLFQKLETNSGAHSPDKPWHHWPTKNHSLKSRPLRRDFWRLQLERSRGTASPKITLIAVLHHT